MGNERMKKDEVNNESSMKQPKTTVSFYGKKLYTLNPAIGRRKVAPSSLPNYEDASIVRDAQGRQQAKK